MPVSRSPPRPIAPSSEAFLSLRLPCIAARAHQHDQAWNPRHRGKAHDRPARPRARRSPQSTEFVPGDGQQEGEIPDAIWGNAHTESASTLPVGWEAEPAGRTIIRIGTDWARSGRSALLIVPSVIVPEEFNVLINPRHPDSNRISAVKVRKWLYDPRLTKTAR